MRIVLDAGRGLDWTVGNMKMKILAGLGGLIIIVATGCVSTVSGTHTGAYSLSRDRVEGRYQRSLDQVYQAAVQVVQTDGVLVQEFIPHDTTNVVRSLQAKVNKHNVWIRVTAETPQITQITVQARSGTSGDVDLAHELEKEVALRLAAE